MNKKVAIFSVGRSGSKALQLYISTGLAREFGGVWVSYEPFMYKGKSLRKNPYGRYLDSRIPKMIKNHLNKRQKKHLDNFAKGINSGHATVAKFIRAGGRSKQVVRRLDVDVVFLLVRDLYGVVESIARRTWNLQEEWRRFCYEAKGEYPFIDSLLKPNTDKLLQSAIHWFVMNDRMIRDLKEDDCSVVLVRYKDIDNLEDFCRSSGLPTPPTDLDRQLLQGRRIHSEAPLTSVHVEKGVSNHFRKWIPATIWRQVPVLAPRCSGSLCVLNRNISPDSFDSDQQVGEPSLGVKAERNSLLDTLRAKISAKMTQAFGVGIDDPVVGGT